MMEPSIISSIEWISERMESEAEPTSYSLWSTLYYEGLTKSQIQKNLPKPPDGAAPTIVFITGPLSAFKSFKGPLGKIGSQEAIVFLVNSGKKKEQLRSYPVCFVLESIEPVLKYITICYIPPNLIINYLDEIGRIAVFTTGKPELWMRPLLLKQKVFGLVNWGNRIEDDWKVKWSVVGDDFSYSLFLQDKSFVKAKKVSLIGDKNLIPVGLKLGLQRALKEDNPIKRLELWERAMDEAATQLLDEEWLLKQSPIDSYLPVLMEKVSYYLEVIRSISPDVTHLDQIIEMLELWCTWEVLKHA
jgi:hypothetical protein